MALVRILFSCILLAFTTAALSAASFDDSKVFHIEYPTWFKDSPFHDLAEDLKNARSSGKQGLMVLFTTEGCSYCDVFIQKSLGDPGLAEIVQKQFDSVGLEIFDDTEMTDPRGAQMSIKHYAKKEGAHFSPTLLFYGDKGEIIYRAVGYQSPKRFRKILSFLDGDHYRSESFRDYLKRHTVDASNGSSRGSLKSDSLFSKPPYALARNRFAASQPLLVIFERPGCKECEAFHNDVLTQGDVRDALKNFEIVHLDAADGSTRLITPDGKQYSPEILV